MINFPILENVSSGALPDHFFIPEAEQFSGYDSRKHAFLGRILLNLVSSSSAGEASIAHEVLALAGETNKIFKPANLSFLEIVNPFAFADATNFNEVWEKANKPKLYSYRGMLNHQTAELLRGCNLSRMIQLEVTSRTQGEIKSNIDPNYNFSTYVIPHVSKKLWEVLPLGW